MIAIYYSNAHIIRLIINYILSFLSFCLDSNNWNLLSFSFHLISFAINYIIIDIFIVDNYNSPKLHAGNQKVEKKRKRHTTNSSKSMQLPHVRKNLPIFVVVVSDCVKISINCFRWGDISIINTLLSLICIIIVILYYIEK